MKAGVIGLGDMGSGLAKNLIANGFETCGFDLDTNFPSRFSDENVVGGTGHRGRTCLSESVDLLCPGGDDFPQPGSENFTGDYDARRLML